MNWYHLIYELPAILTGSSLLAFLSPWRITARLQMLIMIIAALAVLAMPEYPDVALALLVPVAYIQKKLGVNLTRIDDPVKIPVDKIVRAVNYPMKYLKAPKAVPIRQFLTKNYPDPESGEDPESIDPEDQPPPDIEPPTQIQGVKKYVPEI